MENQPTDNDDSNSLENPGTSDATGGTAKDSAGGVVSSAAKRIKGLSGEYAT